MIRVLLTILLPIALPLLLYLAYVKLVRPQPAPGAPADADPMARQNRRTFWIALGVCAVLIAGMVALGLSRGVPPGTKLIAPRMEDGKIVPSQRLDEAR